MKKTRSLTKYPFLTIITDMYAAKQIYSSDQEETKEHQLDADYRYEEDERRSWLIVSIKHLTNQKTLAEIQIMISELIYGDESHQAIENEMVYKMNQISLQTGKPSSGAIIILIDDLPSGSFGDIIPAPEVTLENRNKNSRLSYCEKCHIYRLLRIEK